MQHELQLVNEVSRRELKRGRAARKLTSERQWQGVHSKSHVRIREHVQKPALRWIRDQGSAHCVLCQGAGGWPDGANEQLAPQRMDQLGVVIEIWEAYLGESVEFRCFNHVNIHRLHILMGKK